MKLSTIQFSPELFAKKNNIEKMIELLNECPEGIVVFPELASTGYFFLNRTESVIYAEEFDGNTVNIFSHIAKEQNKIIAFGFIEKENENLYNSVAIIFPDNSFNKVYRKTHLFYKERFCFDDGNTGFFNIFYPDWDINIGTMICYDWRFPESARTLALKGADLIICPSNLVTNIWTKVMPARAIENKVYLAVANRTGTEVRDGEELQFNGLSAIYSYNGEEMASADSDSESILTVDIDPKKTRNKSFNEINNIFSDRVEKYYI